MMSAVNDIVTPYNHLYQAKDTLKRYVPQLRKDSTPGLDRVLGRVHLRILLSSVPAQSWDGHLDSTRDQLSPTGLVTAITRRRRHCRTVATHSLPASFPMGTGRSADAPETDVDLEPCTPVVFDIGEAILLNGCALQNGRPVNPVAGHGGRIRELHRTLQTTLQRLQEREPAEWRIDQQAAYFRNTLGDKIETATSRVVDYAGFEQPVIVLEAFDSLQDNLDVGPHLRRRLHAWAFDRLQTRLADKAVDTGIPVRYVDLAYTSHLPRLRADRNPARTGRVPLSQRRLLGVGL